jgi:nucleotide-binding universal stress UspA family protein
MILISYGGSTDAKAAIEHAGELLSGQTATVLTVWEPFVEVLGSVSHAVIQHADRTVIVVSSPAVAAARGQERHEDHEAG